jgi:HEAT repeat protein
MHAIDSAMNSILMSRYDMSMRWDSAPDDPHRLNVVKYLFEDPLASFAVADSLAAAAWSVTADGAAPFDYFGHLLDLKEFPRINPPTIGDADIMMISRVNMNTLDFTSAVILRKFLSIAVATDIRVIDTRSMMTSERFARIVSYVDSLVLQGESDGESSLVEMRKAELYGIERSKQFFNVDAANLDYARLLNPGVALFVTALESAQAMQRGLGDLKDSVKTRIWDTPMGKVAIGGPGQDIYDGEFFCIVDVGGNDIYRAKSRTKGMAVEHGTSLIVDFDGDDTYIGGDFAFGGTLFGASTLIDMKGNDNYTASDFSLGTGYFGTGILYDKEGSDRYSGGTCVEGAGLFGIGLLIDRSGNDAYMAHLESQGFGYVRGLGAIIEQGGNDSYIASSPYTDYLRYDDHFETFCQGASLGARPVASAGIGIIADSAGSDTYYADIFGQGVSYWFGLGALVDRRGNDAYTAFQYAQGSGVHLAFGVLHDMAGSDNYVSHGVSQGCGHDIGFGGLFDDNGADNYVVESLSLGGGNADAVSLFVDGGGRDGYIARELNTLGYSDLRRSYGMIGIFLDLDGKDFYGTSRGGNDSLWTGSFYGVGLDANMRPADAPEIADAGPKEKTQEEIEQDLAKDIPTLFVQASAAPQKYQYIVEPARNRLIAMADSSIPFLMQQLNSESARERLALGILLPRMGTRVVQALIDTVLHGDTSRIGQAIYALGEMKDTTAAVALGMKLVDTTVSWRMRASAGEALLKMNAVTAKNYLIRALADTVELVRGRAARALARVASSRELQSYIIPLLDDRSQIVRYQIQLGLRDRGIDSVADFLAGTLPKPPGNYPGPLLSPLAKDLKSTEARRQVLEALLKSEDANSRIAAIRLAIAWNDESLQNRVERLLAHEDDSRVLAELDRLPRQNAVKGVEKKVEAKSEPKVESKQESRKKRQKKGDDDEDQKKSKKSKKRKR